MKRSVLKIITWGIAALLILSLIAIPLLAQTRSRTPSTPQLGGARTAFENGYASGYQDGFSGGQNDFRSRLNRDFRDADQYRRADRGYSSRFGDFAAYQDGYRLGYEMAYLDGYYGRPFASRVPTNAFDLREPATVGRFDAVDVPDNTLIRLRLNEQLNTKTSKQGDRFTARVLDLRGFEGATVAGHIARLNRSGRMTGRTEMALAFDTITLPDGRTGSFHAQVEEVHASDSVKTVDQEGNVESSSRTRDTTIRSGGGAALGAIIGAIAGGGKGAAIGAVVGAGVGAGSVFVQGQKDLLLEPGSEMTVRTATTTRAR
jgi:outer membrane lipoprotein SlyB